MKNKLVLTLISSLILTNSVFAEFDAMDPVDFTGDALFMPATATMSSTNTAVERGGSSSETLPPLKNLRLRIQEKLKYRDAINSELAPTAKDLYDSETVGENTEVSEYTSQEEKEIGALILDLGGETMSVGVYVDGILKFSRDIPYGCDLITKDLSRMLHTSFVNAKEIKEKYGVSFPTFLDETAMLFDRIWVSGGRVGLNIAVAPQELLHLINGEFADIAK